jgi:hypothetical protein
MVKKAPREFHLVAHGGVYVGEGIGEARFEADCAPANG